LGTRDFWDSAFYSKLRENRSRGSGVAFERNSIAENIGGLMGF
jgi:hypothetical protein